MYYIVLIMYKLKLYYLLITKLRTLHLYMVLYLIIKKFIRHKRSSFYKTIILYSK